MTATKAGNRCYSQQEAASKLGMTLLELRALIGRYVSTAPLDPDTVLRETDLIALRVLAGRAELVIH